MRTIKEMTLKEKLGQLIIAGFDGYEYDEHLRILIEEYKVANIILFTRNISSLKQLIELNLKIHQEVIKNTKTIPFISIDQEGGMVTRIMDGATFWPGNMTLTATDNKQNAEIVGKGMGEELTHLGINMNLAPSLDVNNNPANPVIGVRSYSDDPNVVSEYGISYIRGLQSENVIATAKHFPGHGDTNVDSHLGLPTVSHDMKRLEEIELLPFKKAIESGVDAIMSAHIIFDKIDKDYPTTLSKTILTDILRHKFNFKGLIVSDCMQMKAIDTKFTSEKGAVMGIKAGLDIACISHTLEKQIGALKLLEEAVLNNEIPIDVIDEKVERILKYKEKTKEAITKNFYSYFDKQLNNIKTYQTNALIKYFENENNKNVASKLVDQSLTLLKGKIFQNKGKVLVVAANPFAATIAEDELNSRSIVDMVHKEIPTMDAIAMESNSEDYHHILDIIPQYDQVVICSYNANTFLNQARFIKQANKIAKELYVLSTRNPYDYLVLDDIENLCCLYEYTPNSVSTVIKYLKGEILPKGKFPIHDAKTLEVSASIYLGLDDYSLKDNLKYLETLQKCNIDTVFISTHMPEMNNKFQDELKVVLDEAKKKNLKIILDVNKNRLNELEKDKPLEDIYALRLDYGFTKEDILKMLNKPYLLELNASCTPKGTLEYLKAFHADFSRIRISHNFYPKPYTGLSYEDVLNKNDYFHQFGLKVICYIPSHTGKRPPLYEGLPTIEEQRNADLQAILSEIVKVHSDGVCFGDAFASEEELKEAKCFDTSIVHLPILVKKGIHENELALLKQVHRNRLDNNQYFVRSSVRCNGIIPWNNIKRLEKMVTIDNEKFLRYQGEVCVMTKTLDSDERVNIVARCLASLFLLEHIEPGEKFSFVIRGEEE